MTYKKETVGYLCWLVSGDVPNHLVSYQWFSDRLGIPVSDVRSAIHNHKWWKRLCFQARKEMEVIKNYQNVTKNLKIED